MGLTVVGVFNTTSDAKKALDQLVAAGFSQNKLELLSQSGTPLSADELIPDPSTNQSGLPTVKLLDNSEIDNSKQNAHPSTQLNQGSVVAVQAPTDEEARQAVQILNDNGAIEVNKRVGTYDLGSGSMGSPSPQNRM